MPAGSLLVLLVLLVAALGACGRPRPLPLTPMGGGKGPARDASSEAACFSVASRDDPASVKEVFAAQHCQGGGVTWAGLLYRLLDRLGRSDPDLRPPPGWLGDVRRMWWQGHAVRVAIDDEADAALFCADSLKLLDEMSKGVRRLDRDPDELVRLIEADPVSLECLPPGFSASAVLERAMRLRRDGGAGNP